MGEDPSRPVVTVIVPVYNMADMLPDALNSVQAQTFKDWECIVVDDGSMDTSYNVARAFGERDPRVWAIRLERNGGAPRAFNTGLDRAQGKYVAHLAADDYWLDDFLEKCVAVLENDQMCPAAYTDFIEWQQDAGLKFVRKMPDFDYARLLREDYVNFSAFVSRSAMWLNPRWEPVADWDAVIRTAQNGPLVRIPKLLAVRRTHGRQISVRRRGAMVVKSLLLSFHYSPWAALHRLYLTLSWPVVRAIR